MLINRSIAWMLLPAVLLAAPCLAVHVGTFNVVRGGDGSLLSAENQPVRQAIEAGLSKVSFWGDPMVGNYLRDVTEILWLDAVAAPGTPITPLSPGEQTALFTYASGHQYVVIFCDNDTDFAAANASLLAPFGMSVTGTLAGDQTITVTDPASTPITDGPFGLVTNFTVSSPGWFDDLGPYAQSLATLDGNGQTVLAWIPPGTITSYAGGVVFFTDSEPDSLPLLLNIVAEWETHCCPWDIDNDGQVTPFDAHVAAYFGCSVGTGDTGCDRADIDGDRQVDPFDFVEVLANFGPCPN